MPPVRPLSEVGDWCEAMTGCISLPRPSGLGGTDGTGMGRYGDMCHQSPRLLRRRLVRVGRECGASVFLARAGSEGVTAHRDALGAARRGRMGMVRPPRVRDVGFAGLCSG